MSRTIALIEVVHRATGHVEIHKLLSEVEAGAFSPEAAVRHGFQLNENGRWHRAMTAENIEAELARSTNLAGITWRQITTAELPLDYAKPKRLFRNCWRSNGGKVAVDMSLARDEHMTRVRRVRDGVLKRKDGDWMREFSRGNQAAADAIEAERQRLRDVPQAIDAAVKSAETPEDLKAIWPQELITSISPRSR